MPRWTTTILVAALLLAGGSLSAQDKAAENGVSETAIFAGGCFWCVEQAFDDVPGVVETTSGYTGGTGHAEAVRVRYDPSKVTYDALLDAFWHNIDPTDAGGQFCDRGESYKSVIFVANDAQRKAAEASKAAVAKKLGTTVATKIVAASAFYPAEEYHQDYYLKNPIRYKFYKWNCGRAQRLEQIWGKPADKHS